MSAHGSAPARGRLALDLVTPLPPVRSGIADYARDQLPHLDRLCDLRLIRLPGQPVADEIASRWPPAAAREVGAAGRLPLYEMGNNAYHEAVLALALERPGVLRLHDLVLHHLLVESTLGRDDPEGYRERLAADHGWIGELAARARRWGELGSAALFELPANRTVVRRQRGVLVHSRWAAERVRLEAAVAVRTVPMGMPLPPPPERGAAEAFRRRHGLPPEAPLLGSFGFQTPIKRTEVAIRAMAQPELAEAHLVIVGEVSKVLDYENLAREIGVADRIHVTGFIPFEEFEAAIAACQICLNLRYPTAGETSASLLRVLAAGRPVAVSEYAQFAELPAEVAVQVPLGDGETEALAARVGPLLGDRRRLRRMGEAARDLVAERHDPAAAARSTIEAIHELAELEPPGDEPAVVPAPTTVTWSFLEGRLEVRGAEPPWRVGEARRLAVRLFNDGFCQWLASSRAVGGVVLELQWRPSPTSEPLESNWVELGRDLGPGESFGFEIELRRPRGAGELIVEPHVEDRCGFGELGGPTWIGRFTD